MSSSVISYGADPTGVIPSSASFTAALAAGQTADVPTGTYLLDGTVHIAARQHLRMEQGAILKPASNTSVLRLHAGGAVTGGQIDTRGVPSWWNSCIDINGDDEAIPDVFRLHVPTIVRDITFYGAKKFGGVGLNVHSDGISNARIMGVDAQFRAYGLEVPLYLKVGGATGSQFISANTFRFMASDSWRGFLMYGPNAASDIAGNEIYYQHQPDVTTTVPSAEIKGQINRIYALPWDWNSVTSGAKAVLIQSGSRNNWVDMPTLVAFLQNSSGNSTNLVRNAV